MWCYCIFVYNILRQMNDQCVISRWWSWQNAFCDHRFLRRLIDSPFALHQLENGQLHTEMQNEKCKQKYSNASTHRNTKNTNIAKTDPPFALHQLKNRQMHTDLQNANTNTKHKYSNANTNTALMNAWLWLDTAQHWYSTMQCSFDATQEAVQPIYIFSL